MAKRLYAKGKIFLTAVVFLLVSCIFASLIYVNNYYRTTPGVVEALASVSDICVTTINKDTLVFSPDDPKAGLIFYPGGKVEYTAYAPLMQAFAEEGILCVLVKMPGNLAVLDQNAADGLQAEFPNITDWYIGGHSLGGSMAASYVSKHTKDYQGLILLAAYSTADLSDSGLTVFSLYGTEDQVLGMDAYQKYYDNLPDDLIETVIEGGSHAQFGAYGPQKGDGTPTISAAEQLRAVIDCCCPVMLANAN